jgi:hypothetical protein
MYACSSSLYAEEPNMSMVKFFCIRDPKVFLLCDQSDRCALHLGAQNSESVKLLQTLLQIDEAMAKMRFVDEDGFAQTPLGLLCRRREFPTFQKMVACLIAVDSSAEIITGAIMESLESYDRDSELKDHNIYPGSRGKIAMILIGILLNANGDVTKYDDAWIFQTASRVLRGELGVAVLSLFHAIDITGLKTIDGDRDSDDFLPIHHTTSESSVEVMKFLYKAYSESLVMLTENGENLLHLAIKSKHLEDMKDKVECLCEQSPAFLHQKNQQGLTPLHLVFLYRDWKFNFFDIKTLIYF